MNPSESDPRDLGSLNEIERLKLELQYAITKGCYAEFRDEEAFKLLNYILELEEKVRNNEVDQ